MEVYQGGGVPGWRCIRMEVYQGGGVPGWKCIRVEDIKQWISQNFLHLNEEKTEYILFSPDSPSSSLSFGPLTPQFAPTVRNLGVIFDKSMHFDKQISAVVK
ncbi:uncharacterized protein LOC116685831, partial [Tachysurus ichikawai]